MFGMEIPAFDAVGFRALNDLACDPIRWSVGPRDTPEDDGGVGCLTLFVILALMARTHGAMGGARESAR